MPYAPGIEYHGDRYAFQGITGAANSIAQGIDEFKKKREQIEKEQALNDPIMAHANEEGWITDEEFVKYQQAPHKQKQSIANALMANVSADLKREEIDQRQRNFEAQQAQARDIAGMHWGQAGFAPPPEVVAALAAKGIMAAPTSRGSVQYIDTNRQAKPALPNPGDPIYSPDGKQIGQWNANGTASYYPQGKGEKKLTEAEQRIKDLDEATKASAGGGQQQQGPGIVSQVRSFFGGAKAPVHVANEEEALAQPSGTTVILPDGRMKVRP